MSPIITDRGAAAPSRRSASSSIPGRGPKLLTPPPSAGLLGRGDEEPSGDGSGRKRLLRGSRAGRRSAERTGPLDRGAVSARAVGDGRAGETVVEADAQQVDSHLV